MKKTHAQKGFTLVELLVSLALFAVVMTLAAAATLTLLDANAKSQSSSSIMTNLNIAVDAMSREIRTGSGYTCGGMTECADGSNSFEFTTQEGNHVIYTLANGAITKKIDAAAPVEITAPEITITKLSFYGHGFEVYDPLVFSYDLKQPLVRIIIQGKAGRKEKLVTEFAIQTSISQRLLDI